MTEALVHELPLSPEGVVIDISGWPPVQIVPKWIPGSTAADVEIGRGDTRELLLRFAHIGVSNKVDSGQTSLLPHLYWVILENANDRCLLLIGAITIVMLYASHSPMREVLHMHRDLERDTGYDNLRAFSECGNITIIYETGAARIGSDGSVIWHCELTLNDVFLRTDDHFMYYWSDYAPVSQGSEAGYFSISLSSGLVHQITEVEARGYANP